MKNLIFKSKIVCLLCSLFLSPFVLSHEAVDKGCSGYDRDVTQEMKLLTGVVDPMPDILEINKAYQLKLKPQTEIKLLAEPHRISLDDASFAVILPIDIQANGNYRISSSTESWIDIVKKNKGKDNYQVVTSTDFSGRFECETLRKLVEYQLDRKENYFIQITGSVSSDIKLVISSLTQ